MIEVRGLGKQFGNVSALEAVSFTVKAGETVSLLGPNGSGKTTTLKCIADLVHASTGEILVGGVDVKRNPVEAKRLLSYLPQRVNFPEQLTAREVLEYFAQLRKAPSRRIDEILAQCSLTSIAGRVVTEFSGGMMQRLGIAVALLPDAPVLLLDEPTASLDPQGAAEFRSTLATLKSAGKTILFSSHALSDVEALSDRVAILIQGRLRLLEPVESLRDALNAEAVLRIRLANTHVRFCAAAMAAGASTARCSTAGLVVSARSESRYSILRTLESAGAEILGFSTADGSIEDLYLRCLNEEDVTDPAQPPADRLRDPVAAAG